jgi:hypothetical protein
MSNFKGLKLQRESFEKDYVPEVVEPIETIKEPIFVSTNFPA